MSIESTLHDLELRLLDPGVRADRSALDALLAEGFIEYGSSGRVYSKSDILAELPAGDDVSDATVSNFAVRVAGDTAHLNYRLTVTDTSGNTRHSLRSSVWQLHRDSWRLCFHQGTASDG